MSAGEQADEAWHKRRLELEHLLRRAVAEHSWDEAVSFARELATPRDLAPDAQTWALRLAAASRWGSVGLGAVPSLDAMLPFGVPFGRRILAVAEPSACKTALAVTLALYWASQGVVVGYLPADEGGEDISARFLQAMGANRAALYGPNAEAEALRAADTLSAYTRGNLLVCEPHTPLETAGDLVSVRAADAGAVLVIDSLHEVALHGIEDLGGHDEFAAARARVRALRQLPPNVLTFATVEANRDSFRDANSSGKRKIAAGAGTRKLEYAAHVQLHLSVDDAATQTVALRCTKNRFGPRHRDDDPGIGLVQDRNRSTVAELQAPLPSQADRDKAAKRELAAKLLDVFVTALRAGEGWLTKDVAAARLGGRRADAMGAIDQLLAERRLTASAEVNSTTGRKVTGYRLVAAAVREAG